MIVQSQPYRHYYHSPQKIIYNSFSISPSPPKKISHAKVISTIYTQPKKQYIRTSPQPIIKYHHDTTPIKYVQKKIPIQHLQNNVIQTRPKIIRATNKYPTQLKKIRISKAPAKEIKINYR